MATQLNTGVSHIFREASNAMDKLGFFALQTNVLHSWSNCLCLFSKPSSWPAGEI